MRPDQRIVIVGGGPAALSTARSYREAGGRGVDRPHLRRAASALRPPAADQGVPARRGRAVRDLPLESEAWFAAHAVTLRARACRAVALDRAGARVHLEGGQELDLRRLRARHRLGAAAPAGDGRRGSRPAHVRTVDDALRLRGAAQPGARAVVVGAGFIACEAAASLVRRGIDVVARRARGAPAGPAPGRARRRAHHALLCEARRRGPPRRRGRAHRAALARVAWPAARRSPPTSCCSAPASRPRVELAAGAGLDARGRRRAASTPRCAARTRPCSPWATSPRPSTPAPGRRLRVEHWGDALAHGEVAGPRARRRGRRLDDRTGLLDHHRRPHAQVLRVGRRLRRGARGGRGRRAPRRALPARRPRRSACSPWATTTPTRPARRRLEEGG